MAAADFSRDTASSTARDFNSRSLSGVVAHEITHGLIRHRLGLIRGLRLPGWVAEGYCDYVAREGSFPEEPGRRLAAAGQGHPSASFHYFVNRQMVRYLIEERQCSFSQVVARAHDYAAVEEETRLSLQSHRID